MYLDHKEIKENKFQFKTELKKPQQEVVDKCLEFNEAVNKIDQLKGNKDLQIKLADGLEFSESTLSALEFASPDTANPVIGNLTFGTLNMLVQEVGSSIEKDTILSLAFPDKSVPMYNVMLDRIVGNTGILPEMGTDSSTLPTVRPLDSYALTYQPGLWGARTMLNSQDIMFARMRGERTFEDRGIAQLVAYNSVNMVTQAMTRKKYLLNQAIFFNNFTYAGATVASNIPAANYVAMYEPLGSLNADGSVVYNTADPLYTPFVAFTNILNNPIFLKYRRYIKGLICNGADLQAIMDHPNVKTTTNLLMAAGASLGNKTMEVQIGDMVKTLNTYYAPSFQFPLLADDDVWVGQNPDGTTQTTPNDATNPLSAQNFFVPRGRLYVLLDLTPMGGQCGAFHLTYNQVDPNVEAPAMGLFTGVFNRNLNNADTINRLDIVAALAGAPAIYMPEAQFILTGLYSNIP